jgi:DNA-binding response OmpR family regulator
MQKTILLVDDEESILDLIGLRLRKAGYLVETASDGPSALNKARELNPDLIVLDVMLPGMNGYKICQMLKFDENYQNIPIILLSARDQESDRNIGMQTGADIYLVKDASQDLWGKLQDSIENLIGH